MKASAGAEASGITVGISGPRFKNDMMTRHLNRAQTTSEVPIRRVEAISELRMSTVTPLYVI
jgi:hypothetical protein